MGQSPFLKRPIAQDLKLGRRRSARIDFVTPIILTGRDAFGQTFREETVTLIVNLHGAKLRTSKQVLVGMQVGVEVVRTQLRAKAICVRAEEAPPGQTAHDIAVQLITAGNIWGVENPPEDWAAVAAELGGRLTGAEPAASEAGTPLRPGPAVTYAAPTPSVAAGRTVADLQMAELERRAAQLTDLTLQNLRSRVEGSVRDALQNFERRLGVMVAGAESQLSQRVERAYAELKSAVETLQAEAMEEIVRDALQNLQRRLDVVVAKTETHISQRASQASAELKSALETLRSAAMEEIVGEALQLVQRRLDTLLAGAETRVQQRQELALSELGSALATFRADVEDELAARRAEFVESAEQALRTKVAALLSSILAPVAGVPAGKPTDPESKK